ncbi:chondroitinase-B domain-containing protein [Lutibacter sp. TH_r2]|uniref:chondroitinase-B domain-containing protein n=1 Tax=Lutibacter sp. TH_r2 TaxID=3082083 RepID=UPI002953BE03|nr:chondroitinase-B domain-containing protein [Lutibacter sp. TH_r2]MDV7187985.1 chondroitinase-B domain-containing protein [Lutibacter sp. TH_r2]
MKYYALLVSLTILLFSCTENSKQINVKNIQELNTAIKKAVPGDEIVLADGIWKNVQVDFYGLGTAEKPITLRAQTSGKVYIEGESYIHLGGKYLNIKGFYFRNGYTPNSAVIRYMIGKDSVAFNCRVTNTVIEGFTKPDRLLSDHWIEFYGKNNQLDHCYISGKSNDGETIRVFFTGNKHINTHHQIVNNYFGPRPRKGGPRGETVRVGDSKTRVSPGFVNVSNNYFEACNGEVEIISDKTNFNSYKNNIFYKCEGSLVLRHGSYAIVDGNIFIGDDDSDFYGGIRVVNSGHWITNNYFYKINGAKFRAPLAVMNGIPMTPLNRYLQVSDVVIAYNTWVDCKSTWQIGVGQNLESADVLPPSEIRSAPPIRSIIANNLIYNSKVDKTPILNHSSMDGILFKNNLIDNNGSQYSKYNVLQNGVVKIKKINNWLYAPVNVQNKPLNEVFLGYDFDKIQNDIFGASRIETNSIGAINNLSAAEKFKINKKNYGPDWFKTEKEAVEPTILTASSAEGDLAKKIMQAADGDIIELTDKLYTVKTSLKIDKNITLRSKNKAELLFTGKSDAVGFQMYPKGTIKLENLMLKGENGKHAFGPLKENMGSAYNLFIENCTIKDFDYVLKATKGSFADSLNFKATSIKNCKNGIELAADVRGDYNAEMVTFNQCTFENVQNNVINFFRDGYDESTIGGYLTVTNSYFVNCGKSEKSNILIKTRGIINLLLNGNTFKNNSITSVAVLWGEKNNHHANNTLVNSGKIKVEEQQKLKILY